MCVRKTQNAVLHDENMKGGHTYPASLREGDLGGGMLNRLRTTSNDRIRWKRAQCLTTLNSVIGNNGAYPLRVDLINRKLFLAPFTNKSPFLSTAFFLDLYACYMAS